MKDKSIFDDVMASAKAFVEKHKGAWDHEKWEAFLSDLQEKGVSVTEEVSNSIGGILESLKKIYSMDSESSHSYSDITAHAKSFVEKYKGLWDHEKWENLLHDIQQKGVSISDEKAQAIGAILESINKFYGIVPRKENLEGDEEKGSDIQKARVSEEEKEEFIKKLEDKLNQWNAKIDILEANSKKIKKEHKDQYTNDMNEILSLWKEAKLTIQKLKKSDDEQWEQLQDRADAIWNNFESAIEKSLSFVP